MIFGWMTAIFYLKESMIPKRMGGGAIFIPIFFGISGPDPRVWKGEGLTDAV